ncbi:gasdermin-D isoform X2 [Mus pahari]|uniref:gasdermin-D isoform X2 n=1 Tax=Mus pahari TaxID=10093 RepID=UPI001114992C|nr:gasdermin-D isoform X2 [Mus pahari]
MPSAFEKVVKNVIKEVSGIKGDLIPVDSLRNSTSFRPYCLLSRKPPSSLIWKPRYTCVDLSIKDILEPNAPEPEPECLGSFKVSDVVDGNIQGKVTLSGTGEGRISGGATVTDSSSASMNVRILRVTQETWETMQHERHLQQPEKKILQQLRSRGVDLFVVTEVLQTKEEVQITETHSQEGSGQFTLLGAVCLQGEGKGHQSRKKMVTIPAGSILAFRVAQLLIGSKWGDRKAVGQRHHVLNVLATMRRYTSEQFRLLSDGIDEEEVVEADFQGLYVEVKSCASELESLDMELRQQLLENIGSILQDQPSMEALTDSLEQGLCSGGQVQPLDGPAGCILECLVLDSGELVPELAAPVVYLLEAMSVLSETQKLLLAKALETTVLSKQLELVKHVLEQSTPWQEQCSVSLPSVLLGDCWDEEDPNWVLLEECGLRLQVEAPQVHWEPTSLTRTSALYASLFLLSSLGQNPC